ncbi:MAG: hypothetical protein KGO81_11750 [Bacteroidota bacterium]|nr:hypothetical protein [Bacteroidota bacterium]
MRPIISLISLLISLIIGIYSAPSHNKKLYTKVFPGFLFISLLVEIISVYRNWKHLNTIFIYNIFTVIEFSFYLWLIFEIINKKRAKKIIGFAIGFYFITAAINIFFIQGLHHFHTLTYSLGCLLIVAACIYYFYELFERPHFINLLKEPPFWICTGLMFFYTCSFPIYGLSNLLLSLPKIFIKNIGTFIILLNVFLYTMFTIAFLCKIKVRKSSLSLSSVAS